jgi:Tfp pilus assembly protein PilN
MRAVRVEPRRWVRPAWRMAAAYAMVLVLVVGTYAAAIHHGREQQRAQALRAEHQKIQSELQQVKAIAEDTQPVVVLENGDTRVIVDLKRQSQSIYY